MWTIGIYIIDQVTFRNEQVAAPLKLDLHPAPCTSRSSFRNEQVAAPLKHKQNTPAAKNDPTIPQRTSCGPIEASDGR